MTSLVLLVPGRLDTLTGGYAYDRRMAAGLRARGWTVSIRELDDSFPFPTVRAREEAAAIMAGIPDGGLVLVDGLAYGGMPEEVAREAPRLRLVALVHHPLAAETGLPSIKATRLADSERRALAVARAIIVTSPVTAASLADYGVAPERIVAIEPGTDPAPLATGTDGTEPALLSVATMTPRKGHDTLFRALSTLTGLSWHLTCVGSLTRDPVFVERQRQLLRTWGLDHRVTLAGEAREDALAACYDKADVFVLPTRYEGYGMAVAEAVARGLPVVSTPVGAIPGILSDVAGLMVPPGRVGVLADALSLVITDGSARERLARGAREMRGRLPDWDTQAAALDGVLQRIGADDLQR